VDALLYLVKNFVWVLIGFLLIRGPVRSFATAPAEGVFAGLRPGQKAWMLFRLIFGIYCIAVSLWNLGTSLLAYYRVH
jgi:ascorbate-specific PTS system EIIC-type component UlaA